MRSVEFLFVGNGMVFVPFCADSSGSGNRSLPDFLLSGACFLINVKTHPSQKACGGGGEGNAPGGRPFSPAGRGDRGGPAAHLAEGLRPGPPSGGGGRLP